MFQAGLVKILKVDCITNVPISIHISGTHNQGCNREVRADISGIGLPFILDKRGLKAEPMAIIVHYRLRVEAVLVSEHQFYYRNLLYRINIDRIFPLQVDCRPILVPLVSTSSHDVVTSSTIYPQTRYCNEAQ